MDLPNIINQINKDKKAIKLTTLNQAKALTLKRFFSGSFLIDDMTGGGYAFKRVQLLFGAKSSGKNAQLNQMMAYNQRICRHCFGIRPDFYERKEIDRHTYVLSEILLMPMCICEKPVGRKFVFLDYEKSLAIETPKTIKILRLHKKDTGEVVDELDWNDARTKLEELQLKEDLTEEDKKHVKGLEDYLSNVHVEENFIEQMNTVDYLKLCGVLTDELIIGDPETTEEGIEYARDLIKSKEVDGIIWDSLQAAIPKYVKDRDAGDATMGVEAKQNGLLMRHICSAFAAEDLTDESDAYKPAVFITSQVRSSLGGFVSGPDTYSGGNALQHHISLALETKRQCFLKESGSEAKFLDKYYGQTVRIRADKNKLNSPGNAMEYNYFFKQGSVFPVGIDYVHEIITLGIKYGHIERAGAYYKVRGESIQGMLKLVEFFKENARFVGQLYKDILTGDAQ